ncbi:hypothetical protein V8G54_024526 [Vigna mungo]|uniref:Pentatricopeptide repeat-containing protein n=1 Tax=Vigna mungo TaxID=3915 RepID=A0AAQ3N4Z5_VIGMU
MCASAPFLLLAPLGSPFSAGWHSMNLGFISPISIYCDEMKQYRIQPTKQVFMALVHSYAACGNLEKAKQEDEEDEEINNLLDLENMGKGMGETELKLSTHQPPLLIQYCLFHLGRTIKGTLLVNRKLLPRTLHVRHSMFKVEKDLRTRLVADEIAGAMERLTGWKRDEVIGKLLPSEIFGSLCRLKEHKLYFMLQVLLDPDISDKNLNEIKSVLVVNLVSHGQLSEGLLIYEQIKKGGHKLEPKAITCLIEELTQHNGELDGLLLLLNEMSDLDYWVDGCFKVILYCARNNNLSSAILLLKQLKDTFENDEMVLEALFDGVFSAIAESEATHLQFGLDLLWAIKDELGLRPSRQCLDFLLSACANAGDLNNARLIWREYEIAGFPYNVLSYLRMYQTLLAAGDGRSASFILKKIPRDDAEVCAVIMACEETYIALNSVGEKKEQGKRKGRKSKRKSKT